MGTLRRPSRSRRSHRSRRDLQLGAGRLGKPRPPQTSAVRIPGVEASFSAVSSAERVAAFLAGHRGRVTVVVEAVSPAGLSWLAEQTKGRELRLLLGEDFSGRWASELRAVRGWA